MPPKRIQKSRLNSIDESYYPKSHNLAKSSKVSKRTSRKSLTIEEKSSNAKDYEIEIFDYEDGGYEEESAPDAKKALSRTSLLILDYNQFKAARCVQRFIRGWLARLKYRRLHRASIVIQTEWRRFHARRCYYRKLEALVQQRIEQHYYQAALKIQSLWRGWWVREHIHDHTRLIRLQVTAGEDLLHCVAFKLHHLLRTHQIPGIYSLRNSKALSKVENLLASLTFKTCTERVRKAHDYRQSQIQEAKKVFKNSCHSTEVPFPGHNIHNICVPKCMPLYSEKEADRKMTKILRMFEEANRKDPRSRALKQRQKISQQFRGICKPAPTSFCGDVVHSMKKWKIIEKNHLEIDPNIFQRPQNLENFLKDCKSWWSLLHGNCYCRQDYVEKMAAKDCKMSGRNP